MQGASDSCFTIPPRAAIEYLGTLGPRPGREAESLRAGLEEGYRAVREHEEDISRCRPTLQSCYCLPGCSCPPPPPSPASLSSESLE